MRMETDWMAWVAIVSGGRYCGVLLFKLLLAPLAGVANATPVTIFTIFAKTFLSQKSSNGAKYGNAASSSIMVDDLTLSLSLLSP